VKNEYHQSYYGPDGDERRADIVLIEDKGSGISLRQDLQLTVPVRAYNPGRADKTERLHAVSHLFCMGLVFVPQTQSKTSEEEKPFTKWGEMLIEQICSFPLVEHDDLTDTTSQALHYIKDYGYLTPDEVVVEEDYADDSSHITSNPYAI
jgi:predicted phage terminase large subunit-like protein